MPTGVENEYYLSKRDLYTGEEIFREQVNTGLMSFALSPDGTELLSGDGSQQIYAFDAETGALKRTFESEYRTYPSGSKIHHEITVTRR